MNLRCILHRLIQGSNRFELISNIFSHVFIFSPYQLRSLPSQLQVRLPFPQETICIHVLSQPLSLQESRQVHQMTSSGLLSDNILESELDSSMEVHSENFYPLTYFFLIPFCLCFFPSSSSLLLKRHSGFASANNLMESEFILLPSQTAITYFAPRSEKGGCDISYLDDQLDRLQDYLGDKPLSIPLRDNLDQISSWA